MKLPRNMWLPMSMLILASSLAQAGVLKVATQPVRHPFKDTKVALKLATYPLRHPKKAIF